MTLQEFKNNYVITLEGIKANNNDKNLINFDNKLFDIIDSNDNDFATWHTYKQLFDSYNAKSKLHLLPKQTHYTSKVSSVYLKAKDTKGNILFALFESTNENEQGEHLTNKVVKATEIGNFVFETIKQLKENNNKE